MQCPNCGSAIEPGTAFCPTCGTDVRAIAQASTPPPPPGAVVAARPKQGMSGGVVVGIVAASLVVLFIAGIGGFFVYRSYVGAPSQPTTPVLKLPKVKLPSISSTLSASLGSWSGSARPSAGRGSTASATSGSGSSAGKDGLVTDAEARAVVSKFWDLRIAHDIAGSKALCDHNMLSGENATFVNDKYWTPDSYTITKTTIDQMYIHVTTMGKWQSGEEPTILAVWRDPSTGKVLIDGMLDPQTNPDLVK